MTVVGGIDYGSSRIAIVIPSRDVFLDVKLTPGDDFGALDVLAETTWNVLTQTRAEVVALEASILGMSRNVRTARSLARVEGAIAVAARQAGAHVVSAEPATWKKAVIGIGNADKQAVGVWLQRHHPNWHQHCHTQDLIDATCLALFAQGTLAG